MTVLVDIRGEMGLAGGIPESPFYYSYQITREDDDTYNITVTKGILKCKTIARNIEYFPDAWRKLNQYIEKNEDLVVDLF